MNKLLIAFLALIFSATCTGAPKDDAHAAMQRGEYQKALEILLPIAEAGDVDALGNVGNMYAFGQGTEKDIDKAHSYWLRASDKHLGTAMGNIAVLYVTGQGQIKKDISQAAVWYKRAAEHRHWQSMITLSSLYMLGQGIEQNKIQALAWAGLAASNAPTQAAKNSSVNQLQKIAAGMSKEEIQQAQDASNQLAKIIDDNVAKYKAQ